MLFDVGVKGMFELSDFAEDDVLICFDGGLMLLHGCIMEIVIQCYSPSFQIFLILVLVGLFLLEVNLNVFFSSFGMLVLEFYFIVSA